MLLHIIKLSAFKRKMLVGGLKNAGPVDIVCLRVCLPLGSRPRNSIRCGTHGWQLMVENRAKAFNAVEGFGAAITVFGRVDLKL
jgi:hypothetical protein